MFPPVSTRGGGSTMGDAQVLARSNQADRTDRSDTETLAREDIFTILSNKRRQYVLQYLKEHDEGAVQLRDLVEYVARRENGTSHPDRDARKAVYTSLHQSHLPKLDQHGLIEYDARRTEAEPTDALRGVQGYLEYTPQNSVPWAYYYFGLAGVLALMTLLAWLSIPPFATFSGILFGGITAVLVALSAAAQTIYTDRRQFADPIEPGLGK